MPKTDYSIQEVQDLVHQVTKSISDNQPELWHLPELNICHHMAKELEKIFEGFNVDVELIKDDRRRPDIVIHQRGHHRNNLVVFQVKKNPTLRQVEEDLFKIRDTFFREPYSYKYGIFISVGKLPEPLPQFDQSKVRMIQVYGWAEMTEEDFVRKRATQNYNL